MGILVVDLGKINLDDDINLDEDDPDTTEKYKALKKG